MSDAEGAPEEEEEEEGADDAVADVVDEEVRRSRSG